MAKIMLVEDDNNLREIYEARLLAEGYQIVSAKDGEEALAMAIKEKPDLIISDVMMPKISGFDMLDILRSTEETKNTKVIMMTALSQAEDKARAEGLGADRYLVKSQVTLEDVARVAKEVLGSGSDTPDTPQAGGSPSPDPGASSIPSAPTPPATPAPSDPAASTPPATNDDTTEAAKKIEEFIKETEGHEDKSAATEATPIEVKTGDNRMVMPHEKVLQPISDMSRPDIHKLLEKEEANEKSATAKDGETDPNSIAL